MSTRATSANRAILLACLGRHSEARAERDKFKGIESPDDESALPIMFNLFESAILGYDKEFVRAVIPRLQELADFLMVTPAIGGPFSMGRIVGDGFSLIGEHVEARARYERGLVLSQAISARPEIALIRLDLAELLLEHYPDERDAAIEHLDFAIAELRDMKMQPALERALRHRGLLHA
jgi:hypothetical protein